MGGELAPFSSKVYDSFICFLYYFSPLIKNHLLCGHFPESCPSLKEILFLCYWNKCTWCVDRHRGPFGQPQAPLSHPPLHPLVQDDSTHQSSLLLLESSRWTSVPAFTALISFSGCFDSGDPVSRRD